MSTAYPYYCRWQEVLSDFLALVQDETSLPQLKQLLVENNLPLDGTENIYHDPQLKVEITLLIESRLRTHKHDYEDEHFQTLAQNFKYEMETDGLKLLTRCQLVEHPDLVPRLANHFRIWHVKTLPELIDLYRKRYYTRQCHLYLQPNVCMRKAAGKGDLEMIRHLLERPYGYDLNEAIARATKHGQLEVVKMLLFDPRVRDLRPAVNAILSEKNIDILPLLLSVPGDKKITNLTRAIHVAIGCRKLDIVELLIDDPRVISIQSMAVQIAVEEDDLEMLYLLLRNPTADVHSAIATAIAHGKVVVVGILLAQPRPSLRLNDLIDSAYQGGYMEIFEFMFQDPRTTNLDAVLTSASARGDLDMLASLLLDPRIIQIYEAIHAASTHNQLEALRLLLESPFGDSSNNKCLQSAIEKAAAKGHTEVVQFLMQNSGPLVSLDYAAREAALKGHLSIVQAMINDFRLVSHKFVLVYAAKAGQLQVIEFLLDDPEIDDIDLAVCHATHNGHLEALQLLLSRVDKIHNLVDAVKEAVPGALSMTRLLLEHPNAPSVGFFIEPALKYNRIDVIEMLLPRMSVFDLDRALDGAARQDRVEIMKLLLEDGRSTIINFLLKRRDVQLRPEIMSLLREYQNKGTSRRK